MDVQMENIDPPPCESQPSGKIRKGFKLFGKRKPGNIFSIRSKGDGNNKSPIARSKTLDGLTETTAPDSEQDPEKEKEQEASQGESGQAEEEPLGEDGVLAASPPRTSISSTTSAKSLSFLSLLRGGRRGGGDRRVQTVSQPVGRQRRGLKGLFDNVKFRQKDKEGKEEAPPSPLLMSSRTNSVEIIKEDLTLTPKSQPRSLDSPETESSEPVKSVTTPDSSATSPSETITPQMTAGNVSRANEHVPPLPSSQPPMEPGETSLSCLLADISSLLTFDSISGGGDIIADVEAEWGKASSAISAVETEEKPSSTTLSFKSTRSFTPTTKPTITSSPISKPSSITTISTKSSTFTTHSVKSGSEITPMPTVPTSTPAPGSLSKTISDPACPPGPVALNKAPPSLVTIPDPVPTPAPAPIPSAKPQPSPAPVPAPTPVSINKIPPAVTPTPAPVSLDKIPPTVTPTLAPVSLNKIPPTATPTPGSVSLNKIPPAVTPSPTRVSLDNIPPAVTPAPAPVSLAKIPPAVTPAPAPVSLAKIPPAVTPAPAPVSLAKIPPAVTPAPAPVSLDKIPPAVTPAPAPVSLDKIPPAAAPTPAPVSLNKIPPAVTPALAPVPSNKIPPITTPTPAPVSLDKMPPAPTSTPAPTSHATVPAPTPSPTPLAPAPMPISVSKAPPAAAPALCPVPSPAPTPAPLLGEAPTSTKVKGSGQASVDGRLAGPSSTDAQGARTIPVKTEEVQNESRATLQGPTRERRTPPAKASGLSKIPVVGGGRAGKLPVRDNQHADDEGSWDPPTPVLEEERPHFHFQHGGSKDKISDVEASVPTSKHTQEESQQLHQSKVITSLPRDSKIPVKQGAQSHSASQIPQAKEPPRTKIPVSKVPVRRIGTKPAGSSTQIRK
ncbi:APC membrane recruitment protein 2-like [Centroberyx affinis]|uniref:APC membrane recruitment protein 2-like n=1 Tax=Centroberyx affinis TaxID=166261 RepID=UPI003A5C2479